MTTAEVAEHLGITPDGAHKWLARRKIESRGRQSGSAAQSLFLRADVVNVERSYRGRRSDLHGEPDRPQGTP